MFGVASRTEQSRVSYTLQTEEFRSLNSNLQTYLNDIKRIDDHNRQLEENIEQIRTDYIRTLEDHLKGLPEDFRRESQVLTDAHLERYRSKSRAKRFVNEREELKKRINFLTNNEKDQIKRLNQLQKQERKVANECRILNEQIEALSEYVQAERQIHQQAMDRVDELQIQLEKICIERSKTEFEIQTLREEVKMMQTAKEFLEEEYQVILSTETEANEYFLSRLNDSISRIREDFHELHQHQFKQIENEYEQMLTALEENNQSTINEQRIDQIDYAKLQDEHQSISEDLIALNDHNQSLSERILAMETDLYAIRDERMRELLTKEKEFECSEMELQTLNSKLNHLAEYDRNLKFELTLYRGVLESEYRRKQQLSNDQQQLQLTRPSTLRTITMNRSTRDSTKNFINRNQLEPVIEKSDIQSNEMISRENRLDEERMENQGELDRREDNFPTQEDQTEIEIMRSPVSTVPEDRLSPTNQELSSNSRQLSNTPLKNPDLSESTLENKEESLASAPPISSQDRQTPAETRPFLPPVTDAELTIEAPDSSTTTPAVFEDQQSVADEQALSSLIPSIDLEIPSELSTVPTIFENEQSSFSLQQTTDISPDEQHIPLESSSISPVDDQSILSDLQETAPTPTPTESSAIDGDDVQEQSLSVPTNDAKNHFTEGSSGYDNVLEDAVANNQPQSSEFSTVEKLEQAQSTTEEPISSSDSTQLINQELSIPFLADTDFIDNLEVVVEDLRYVYRTLLTDDGLVEIDDEFPTHVINRLEFGDNLIRTSFEDFLRKYIVEPTKTEYRSKTLDWIEFRDLLFPILTTHYTEDHLRKLFNRFDTNQTGRLSPAELAELLELLQVNNSSTLAEQMTDESGELNIDQFIKMIRKTDDGKAHLLSEEIELKHWYLRHPNDEEKADTVSVSSETPPPHSPSKINNAMILLGGIFQRVGADVENQQLDSKKATLSMRITNELLHNNIHISNEDLHSFIELYLNQKQASDSLINWIEFRDVFLPLVNGGMIWKDDIIRWFDIFDANHNQTLSSEQILHLLRLLQVTNPEEILQQIHAILFPQTTHFTLAELLFALENLHQTTSHLLPSTDQIITFDLDWLKKHIL